MSGPTSDQKHHPGEPPPPAGDESGYFSATRARACTSEELRTQLANERTFLAWVRTGLALVAFGFVVEKAGPFLRTLAPEIAAQESTFIHTSGIAGIVLMLAGSVVIILATLRFWHTATLIEHGKFVTSTKLDAAIALTIAIISIILIIFLIFQSTAFWGV